MTMFRAVLIATLSILALAQTQTSKAQTVSEQDALEIARDAFIYGYPLVLMDVTRQQLTNFATPPGTPGQGPANQFIHLREFPDPKFKIVIRPNADTLYSSAWLDLKAEPVVLSVPDTDRFFMLPMLSMWSDVFAVPGTRTTGPGRARTFLVTGPGWNGSVPSDMELIKSPTRYVWFIGRTQTNGKADYDNVHKIQDGYKLTLLSGWGKADYTPPRGVVDPNVDVKTPPPVQVDKMDAATFFARFAELLKENPPNNVDYPTLHQLERVGIVVGKSFDLNGASPAIKSAFERGTAEARKVIADEARKSSGAGQGWAYRLTGGAYGVDYVFRAAIANFGLGYNLPQDAVYPSLANDSEERPFDGNNRYVLHFDKGKLPPVRAFWSVTAYDAEGYFIPNVIDRVAIGDRDKLAVNSDGSLDLYLQAETPGRDKEGNWLPVAKGSFNLLMRLYWPKSELLDGSWTPPPVRRVN
ncbi:MAG: DUF1254 domain-containing protein [Xanthobacteraceae bacterium]